MQLRDAFMIVFVRLTVSKLHIEAVRDGSKRLGLVTAESNVHVKWQGVVVAVLRNFASGALEVMQFRFEQEYPLVMFVPSMVERYANGKSLD